MIATPTSTRNTIATPQLQPGTTVLLSLAGVLHNDLRSTDESSLQVSYIGPTFSVAANALKDIIDIKKRMVRIEIRACIIQSTGKAGYWVEYDGHYRFPIHVQNILEVLR